MLCLLECTKKSYFLSFGGKQISYIAWKAVISEGSCGTKSSKGMLCTRPKTSNTMKKKLPPSICHSLVGKCRNPSFFLESEVTICSEKVQLYVNFAIRSVWYTQLENTHKRTPFRIIVNDTPGMTPMKLAL